MGLFLDRDITGYQTKSVAGIGANIATTAASGSVNFGELLPQILAFGMNLAEEYSEDNDKATEEKIKAKTSELDVVFSEASTGYSNKIANIEDLNNAINDLYKENNPSYLNSGVQSAATNLANLKNSVSGQNSSSSIANELRTYYSDVPECKQVKPEYIDKQSNQPILPAGIEQRKKAYETAIAIEQKQIPEAQKKLEEAKAAELARLTALKGQVENLQNEIDGLREQVGFDGEKFDVKQETSDIKTFMDALKAFQANKTKENAQKLKKAFEGNGSEGSGIQQKSVAHAYDMVKADVENVLKQSQAA